MSRRKRSRHLQVTTIRTVTPEELERATNVHLPSAGPVGGARERETTASARRDGQAPGPGPRAGPDTSRGNERDRGHRRRDPTPEELAQVQELSRSLVVRKPRDHHPAAVTYQADKRGEHCICSAAGPCALHDIIRGGRRRHVRPGS